jgi:hypothetical protein
VLSGNTDSGNITAQMSSWNSNEQAIIETVRGNITIEFPESFSVDADFWSLAGVTSLQYPLIRSQEVTAMGPEPDNHLMGRIGDGGEILKMFSEHGDITVIKGKF